MIWLWLTLALVVGVLGGLALVLVSLYAYMRQHPVVAYAILATRPDLLARITAKRRPHRPAASRVDMDKLRQRINDPGKPPMTFDSTLGQLDGIRLTPEQYREIEQLVRERFDREGMYPPGWSPRSFDRLDPRRAPRPRPPTGRGYRADRVIVDEVPWLDSLSAPKPQPAAAAGEPPDFNG